MHTTLGRIAAVDRADVVVAAVDGGSPEAAAGGIALAHVARSAGVVVVTLDVGDPFAVAMTAVSGITGVDRAGVVVVAAQGRAAARAFLIALAGVARGAGVVVVAFDLHIGAVAEAGALRV